MATDSRKPFTARERADLAIRFLHPKVAAKKLGLTLVAVMQRRGELGLPAVDVQCRKANEGKSNAQPGARRKPR